MAKRPKVSVIVPIYKVEKYLHECVDSILDQTLKDIEIILIDDGSPDGCGKIIDEYEKTDKRVRAVHQKNSGYSKTVNKGIRLAKGEYVGIIESDDFIEPDMYETLYKNAKKNKTDVTKGDFYIYNSKLSSERQNIVYTNPSGIDLRLAPDRVFKAVEWPKIIGFHASIWSSIYRAKFVKKIKIPETAGASYQDFPFMMEVMTKAKRITVAKKPLVHWRNEPSQENSTNADGEKLLLMVKNTETGLEIVKKSGQYDRLKEAFFAHALWANIAFFFRIDRKYKKEYYERLRAIFVNIKYDSDFRYIYFRTEDMMSVRALHNSTNWQWFYLSHIFGGIRRKIGKILSIFMPTYKIARHLRTEVEELKMQNEVLSDKIDELIQRG